jgi:RNA polymerase sigma-70 factor (ECF subfamily)
MKKSIILSRKEEKSKNLWYNGHWEIRRRINLLIFLLSISDKGVAANVERLYRDYYEDLLRFAQGRLKQSGIKNYEIDAEDAVQNAFVKITKYIDKINVSAPEKAVRSYVFSIVANEVTDIVSRDQRCDDIEEYADSLADEEIVEKMSIKESYRNVVKIIKRMDEKYSTVLMYYFCYDMSVKEIARMLNVSENTVYSRFSRGKLILLKTIGGEDHG